MSLLNSVANREVLDFLRTLTIKSTYFANRSRTYQVNPNLEARVPETTLPYVIHLAGEYILNDQDDNYTKSDIMSADIPYFKGYRLTRDESVKQFKNYWRINADKTAIGVILPNEMETIVNPKAEGLYELQPFEVEGIINPVTRQKETYSFRGSQMIYGAADEISQHSVQRIEGYLNCEVKNSDLFTSSTFDEMMYITSLDTQQEIPFCLEAFYADAALEAGLRADSIHVKTLEAYRIPGRYFDILCERYPKQVDLIKAIVYRVPDDDLLRRIQLTSMVTEPDLQKRLQTRLKLGLVTDAYIKDLALRYPKQSDLLRTMGADIAGSRDRDEMPLWEKRRTRIAKSENFELLAYSTERLDDTESSDMVSFIRKTLNVFKTRWAVDEYNFEENYATVLWTVLWTVLPLAVVCRRYANIKTPFVSISHMWDYLNSKGLASYKGYLTEKETWFLYKNIQYLFQHQAQQKALDILVDNILADYGLTLRAKTVVLESTDSLKLDTKPTLAKTQCETCARRGVSCFRNDKEHICDEWLGTKHLCKAQPIVLTEEFIGATKAQILRILQKNYGYTADAAAFKYRRSFIWRDDDIEKIKNDLNRDQMVDLNGQVESLADTLNAEHISGQEPVVNDQILEEQTNQLQHMNGTYAPTKLLELYKKTYNVKYTDLFDRFVTETFLRFAPKSITEKKVMTRYTFETNEGATSFTFDFGEMLAATYLGFVRENEVDALVDEIVKGSDGKPLYEEDRSVIIDYDKDGKPIYLKRLKSWIQKRFTDLQNKVNYDFCIPDKCKTTTTFKFGKPVLQEDLYNIWKNGQQEDTDGTFERLLAMVTNPLDNTRIVLINGIYYAVAQTTMPEKFVKTLDTKAIEGKKYYVRDGDDWVQLEMVPGEEIIGDIYESDSIWDTFGFPIFLTILGEFTSERKSEGYDWEYHEDTDDEIPLIPKFFRWYYTHLNPAMGTTPEELKKLEVPVRLAKKPILAGTHVIGYEPVETNATQDKDTDEGFVPEEPDPMPQKDILYIDESRKQIYRIFPMKQFLNLDYLLENWVDVMGTINDQAKLASYIDIMFGLLEDIYTYASATCSVRVHVACSTFLDHVLTQKEVRFDLTGTERRHDNTEGGLSAWYSDWLADNEELVAAFNIIDKMNDTTSGWNEFNITAVKNLLDGCTIQYAQDVITTSQYQKLKELVISLSSYRITIVDRGETGQVCNKMVALVEDALVDDISASEIIYFDPIGDTPAYPRVGGYLEREDANGFILVPTSDLRRQDGKQYYQLTVKDSEMYELDDEHQIYHLKERPLAHSEEGLPEGTELTVGSEMINIPASKEWQPYGLSTDTYILSGKTYYKLNEVSGLFVEASKADYISKKVSEITGPIPSNALKDKDDEGNDIVFLTTDIYEAIEIGDRLPVGICFEKISIYDILGVESSTPLLVSRIGTKWYYCIGKSIMGTISYPCSEADINSELFDEKFYAAGDTFDLKNDFSNPTNKLIYDSVVYRLNIPVGKIEWGKPIESKKLEKALYPTINNTFTLREFTENTGELTETYPELLEEGKEMAK